MFCWGIVYSMVEERVIFMVNGSLLFKGKHVIFFFLKEEAMWIAGLGDINTLEGNRKMLEGESVQSMLNSLITAWHT